MTASPARVSACPACTVAPMAEDIAAKADDAEATILLALPTIHCAGCISTVERGLNADPAVHSARVNLTMKRVSIAANPGVTAADMIGVLDGLGYEAHELDASILSTTATEKAGRELLMRLGVAGFAMMNIMLLSVAVWSGAADATRDLFHWISALIALPTIAFSGQPFFKNAYAALRAGRLNMDVPISLAILLAFVSSVLETLQSGEHAYFRRGGVADVLFAGRSVSGFPHTRRCAVRRRRACRAGGAARPACDDIGRGDCRDCRTDRGRHRSRQTRWPCARRWRDCARAERA